MKNGKLRFFFKAVILFLLKDCIHNHDCERLAVLAKLALVKKQSQNAINNQIMLLSMSGHLGSTRLLKSSMYSFLGSASVLGQNKDLDMEKKT